VRVKVSYFYETLKICNDFSLENHGHGGHEHGVHGGFWGGKVSFKKMSAGGRLRILQENPHFWVPAIKVRPPDGTTQYGRYTALTTKVHFYYASRHTAWHERRFASYSAAALRVQVTYKVIAASFSDGQQLFSQRLITTISQSYASVYFFNWTIHRVCNFLHAQILYQVRTPPEKRICDSPTSTPNWASWFTGTAKMTRTQSNS
jgi:hypothetical protein